MSRILSGMLVTLLLFTPLSVYCFSDSYSNDSNDDSSTYEEPSQAPDDSNDSSNDTSNDSNESVDQEPNNDDSYNNDSDNNDSYAFPRESASDAYNLLPTKIHSPGEKVIVVDPKAHAFGAYSKEGKLLRSGLVTAGASWCPDIDRSCRTRAGVFRIYTLGSSDCISHKYPVGRGGAPMPYCMYFNGGQGLHGSNEVVAGNVSHGCVRMHVEDAQWIRFNFASIGTKVIIRSY